MIDEKSTKAEVFAAVQENGFALECASEELRGDRDVVLEAVKQDGRALSASKELRNDREIVLAAMEQNWQALRYASGALLSDRDFMLAAMQQDWRALYYASEELQNDRDFIVKAVKSLSDDSLHDIITDWICLFYGSSYFL